MMKLLAGLIIFAAAPSFAQEMTFKCFGTEPFWNAQIADGVVILAATGEKGEKLVITQRSFPAGTSPTFGQVIKAKGTTGEESIFTIRYDPKCSDGMSETEYSQEVWFLKGTQLVVGCCNPKDKIDVK